MLMLSMNIQKTGCCCLHLTYCTCLTVNFIDTSSLHNFSGKKDLSILRINIKCFQCLGHFLILYLKKQFHQCIGRIFSYHVL